MLCAMDRSPHQREIAHRLMNEPMTTWEHMCDRLDDQRVRSLFRPKQRRVEGTQVVAQLPLFTDQEVE